MENLEQETINEYVSRLKSKLSEALNINIIQESQIEVFKRHFDRLQQENNKYKAEIEKQDQENLHTVTSLQNTIHSLEQKILELDK